MFRFVFFVLIIVGLVPSVQAQDGLKAGAFAMDVTPKKFPISVNGGFTDRQATAANDPLHARCLVISDGKSKVALVIVDSCMIPRSIVTQAKEEAQKLTKIPATNILISATHTHTAPTLDGVFGSEAAGEYVDALPYLIAKGIAQADQNLLPAKLGTIRVNNARQLFNRRWKREQGLIPADPFGNTTDQVQMNPGHQAKGLLEQAGATDPEISIISVQTRDGKPLALYASYSLHYVGGVPALSADYFGMFCERIQQKLGDPNQNPPFMAALSNGTSGDVNNVDFANPAKKGQKPGEQARVVAEDVSNSVLDVYPKIAYRSDITLAVAVKEIELGVRKGSVEEVMRAQEILAALKGKKTTGKSDEVYANETIQLVSYPSKVPVLLQAIRIGDQGIAAIPCEVFAEIGLDLKKRSPIKPMFTVSLANGYNGYLPTPAQHKLGGYETWRARSSYLEVNASDKISETLLELLGKVK
jgi:hypothetical protein